MGNPSITIREGTPNPDPGQATNGILGRVGGEFISAGIRQLPPAGPNELTTVRKVVVPAVPDLGDVTITYKLNSYTHGRSKHWHWVAVHAQKLK